MMNDNETLIIVNLQAELNYLSLLLRSHVDNDNSLIKLLSELKSSEKLNILYGIVNPLNLENIINRIESGDYSFLNNEKRREQLSLWLDGASDEIKNYIIQNERAPFANRGGIVIENLQDNFYESGLPTQSAAKQNDQDLPEQNQQTTTASSIITLTERQKIKQFHNKQASRQNTLLSNQNDLSSEQENYQNKQLNQQTNLLDQQESQSYLLTTNHPFQGGIIYDREENFLAIIYEHLQRIIDILSNGEQVQNTAELITSINELEKRWRYMVPNSNAMQNTAIKTHLDLTLGVLIRLGKLSEELILKEHEIFEETRKRGFIRNLESVKKLLIERMIRPSANFKVEGILSLNDHIHYDVNSSMISRTHDNSYNSVVGPSYERLNNAASSLISARGVSSASSITLQNNNVGPMSASELTNPLLLSANKKNNAVDATNRQVNPAVNRFTEQNSDSENEIRSPLVLRLKRILDHTNNKERWFINNYNKPVSNEDEHRKRKIYEILNNEEFEYDTSLREENILQPANTPPRLKMMHKEYEKHGLGKNSQGEDIMYIDNIPVLKIRPKRKKQHLDSDQESNNSENREQESDSADDDIADHDYLLANEETLEMVSETGLFDERKTRNENTSFDNFHLFITPIVPLNLMEDDDLQEQGEQPHYDLVNITELLIDKEGNVKNMLLNNNYVPNPIPDIYSLNFNPVNRQITFEDDDDDYLCSEKFWQELAQEYDKDFPDSLNPEQRHFLSYCEQIFRNKILTPPRHTNKYFIRRVAKKMLNLIEEAFIQIERINAGYDPEVREIEIYTKIIINLKRSVYEKNLKKLHKNNNEDEIQDEDENATSSFVVEENENSVEEEINLQNENMQIENDEQEYDSEMLGEEENAILLSEGKIEYAKDEPQEQSNDKKRERMASLMHKFTPKLERYKHFALIRNEKFSSKNEKKILIKEEVDYYNMILDSMRANNLNLFIPKTKAPLYLKQYGWMLLNRSTSFNSEMRANWHSYSTGNWKDQIISMHEISGFIVFLDKWLVKFPCESKWDLLEKALLDKGVNFRDYFNEQKELLTTYSVNHYQTIIKEMPKFITVEEIANFTPEKIITVISILEAIKNSARLNANDFKQYGNILKRLPLVQFELPVEGTPTAKLWTDKMLERLYKEYHSICLYDEEKIRWHIAIEAFNMLAQRPISVDSEGIPHSFKEILPIAYSRYNDGFYVIKTVDELYWHNAGRKKHWQDALYLSETTIYKPPLGHENEVRQQILEIENYKEKISDEQRKQMVEKLKGLNINMAQYNNRSNIHKCILNIIIIHCPDLNVDAKNLEKRIVRLMKMKKASNGYLRMSLLLLFKTNKDTIIDNKPLIIKNLKETTKICEELGFKIYHHPNLTDEEYKSVKKTYLAHIERDIIKGRSLEEMKKILTPQRLFYMRTHIAADSNYNSAHKIKVNSAKISEYFNNCLATKLLNVNIKLLIRDPWIIIRLEKLRKHLNSLPDYPIIIPAKLNAEEQLRTLLTIAIYIGNNKPQEIHYANINTFLNKLTVRKFPYSPFNLLKLLTGSALENLNVLGADKRNCAVVLASNPKLRHRLHVWGEELDKVYDTKFMQWQDIRLDSVLLTILMRLGTNPTENTINFYRIPILRVYYYIKKRERVTGINLLSCIKFRILPDMKKEEEEGEKVEQMARILFPSPATALKRRLSLDDNDELRNLFNTPAPDAPPLDDEFLLTPLMMEITNIEIEIGKIKNALKELHSKIRLKEVEAKKLLKKRAEIVPGPNKEAKLEELNNEKKLLDVEILQMKSDPQIQNLENQEKELNNKLAAFLEKQQNDFSESAHNNEIPAFDDIFDFKEYESDADNSLMTTDDNFTDNNTMVRELTINNNILLPPQGLTNQSIGKELSQPHEVYSTHAKHETLHQQNQIEQSPITKYPQSTVTPVQLKSSKDGSRTPSSHDFSGP